MIIIVPEFVPELWEQNRSFLLFGLVCFPAAKQKKPKYMLIQQFLGFILCCTKGGTRTLTPEGTRF